MIYTDMIFIFAFLPIYILALIIPRETWEKNAISVLASVIFLTWGRPWYYALILLPVLIIYICGLVGAKKKSALFEAIGSACGAVYAVFAAVTVGAENSLSSALISVGYLLFALRGISYLSEVGSGSKPEKSFAALAVYLISLENMLIAPLESYESSARRLSERRFTVSKMSNGLSEFIRGLALAAIPGMAFERARLAATEYEAFPWANAVLLVLITAAEAYVICSAFLKMSSGIGLLCGLSPKLRSSAFLPRLSVSAHVGEMYSSLPGFLTRCFCERPMAVTLVSLGVMSLICGIFIGFGIGSCACFVIISVSIVLEGIFSGRKKAADAIFAAILLAAAFMTLALRSPEGFAKFFAALNISNYDYDITYALNEALASGGVWMLAGLLLVSPLTRVISSAVRRKMSENDSFYAAARVTGAAVTSLLAIASAIALA